MSIEEKAKAYDMALERAKTTLNIWEMSSDAKNYSYAEELKDIFPELKESEDERIRKTIKECLQAIRGTIVGADDRYDKALAWLEKQNHVEWSEEDEKTINDIIYRISLHRYLDMTDVEWLKSIKQRMIRP